jgi:uncharacterized protein YebE (UPF0316 family)
MARVKAEAARTADQDSLVNQAKEYAFIKSQMDYLEKQQKELREKLFEVLDTSGEPDDKGNIIVELPQEVDGFFSIVKQKRVSRKVDELVADEIITAKGMEETLYKTVRMVDEDALMAALYNDELTEEEIDQMYPQKITWALVLSKK